MDTANTSTGPPENPGLIETLLAGPPVSRFLAAVCKLFNQHLLESIELQLAPDPERHTREHVECWGAGILDLQRQRRELQRQVVADGFALAPALEREGHDPTLLLKFCSTLDGAGGPTAAAPIWQDLKPRLQRVAIGRNRWSTPLGGGVGW